MRIFVLCQGRMFFYEGNILLSYLTGIKNHSDEGREQKDHSLAGPETATGRRDRPSGLRPHDSPRRQGVANFALRTCARQLDRRAHVPPRKVSARICDDPMQRNECARFRHGCTGTRVSESMADSPAGKAGVEAEDGSPHGAGLPGGTVGSGDTPAAGTIPRDRPVCRVAGGCRQRTGRGGRMPTGVTRGTLSFYLRVSPPRFPARTRAVCSFGAPRMEALQRFVGQQSFRLKDSLRRRPMPFAAGWGLSCCRHPKPSVNGGVSGCRGKRKRRGNTLAFHTKHTVHANSPRSIRTGTRLSQPTSPRHPSEQHPRQVRTFRVVPARMPSAAIPPTPAPADAPPAAGPSVPSGR